MKYLTRLQISVYTVSIPRCLSSSSDNVWSFLLNTGTYWGRKRGGGIKKRIGGEGERNKKEASEEEN